MTASIAGILLAAGASQRLGEPKQLVTDAAGTPLITRAANQLLAVGCNPVVVVIGANAEAIRFALQALPVDVCDNPLWSEGIGSSVRAGVARLGQHSTTVRWDAALLAVCDMPSVDSVHLAKLITASQGGTRRVGSAYADCATAEARGDDLPTSTILGIPAIFPVSDWTGLQMLEGDRGAKRILESPDTLSVFLRQGYLDIDTPTDLAQWRASQSFPN